MLAITNFGCIRSLGRRFLLYVQTSTLRLQLGRESCIASGLNSYQGENQVCCNALSSVFLAYLCVICQNRPSYWGQQTSINGVLAPGHLCQCCTDHSLSQPQCLHVEKPTPLCSLALKPELLNPMAGLSIPTLFQPLLKSLKCWIFLTQSISMLSYSCYQKTFPSD